MRAAAALALAPALALLAGCAGGDDPSPAEADQEATASPSVAVTGEPDGSGGLVVRLPRLAITGAPVRFTAARPLGCVEVALTGDGLPDGASVSIDAFDVPPGFVAAGVACEGLDACLGGPGLRTRGSCSLPLRWDGRTVPAGTPELGVLAASLTCPSQPVCDEAATVVSAGGAGTVDLEVAAPDD